jgi:hypothetical protein
MDNTLKISQWAYAHVGPDSEPACWNVLTHVVIYFSIPFNKEDEVGGTCGTHGGGERCLQGLGWEARR